MFMCVSSCVCVCSSVCVCVPRYTPLCVQYLHTHCAHIWYLPVHTHTPPNTRRYLCSLLSPPVPQLNWPHWPCCKSCPSPPRNPHGDPAPASPETPPVLPETPPVPPNPPQRLPQLPQRSPPLLPGTLIPPTIPTPDTVRPGAPGKGNLI